MKGSCGNGTACEEYLFDICLVQRGPADFLAIYVEAERSGIGAWCIGLVLTCGLFSGNQQEGKEKKW